MCGPAVFLHGYCLLIIVNAGNIFLRFAYISGLQNDPTSTLTLFQSFMNKTYKQELARQQRLLDVVIYLIVAALIIYLVIF